MIIEIKDDDKIIYNWIADNNLDIQYYYYHSRNGTSTRLHIRPCDKELQSLVMLKCGIRIISNSS